MARIRKEMSMFKEIRLLARHGKPGARLSAYRLRPAEGPSQSACFYAASRGIDLAMDEEGSTLRLRLYYCEGLRRARYYADEDTEYIPITAALPNRRGFLAGWTMGPGMLSCLDCTTIYADSDEAERAAHDEAERAAERDREYQEAERQRERDAEEAAMAATGVLHA